MANVLLINPTYKSCYGKSKASIVDPFFPTLGLASIAAVAQSRGHKVKILDLCWKQYDHNFIRSQVMEFKPEVVGITATTPLVNQMRDISVLVKDISKDITVVGGGPHSSALPVETLRESYLDAVCAGESDYSFSELCESSDWSQIKGIYYRSGDEIIETEQRAPIENLDDLPMPAWELYNPKDYLSTSHLIAKYPPVTTAEFSRGCVFKCDYCASKMMMALGYRKKSPERCAEEVKRMHSLGFNEFWLTDDIFTSDQEWAVKVSEAISRSGVKMAWTCSNGIRVESADERLFEAMKRSGCYRVTFGFESGNDEVLKKFGKGGRATVEQGKVAIQKASDAGLDTFGAFMIGLSCDTEETIQDTIDFAYTLPFHYGKFGMAIAFPGTEMFNNYVKKGLIRSFDWDEYFLYTDEQLFAHENLDYATIQKYIKAAYRKVITLNPRFFFRRLFSGLRSGDFFLDLYYGLKFFVLPAASEKVLPNYYAKDRWPVYNFSKYPPKEIPYQVVGKKEAYQMEQNPLSAKSPVS